MSELSRSSKKPLYTLTGWVLLVESLLIFIPLAVLGSAINWPKSLIDPADKMLPLLIQHESSVRFGYLVYLAYSILFGVVSLLIVRVLNDTKSDSVWLRFATGLGMASMITRCLGIIRWLVAMPALAIVYAEPNLSTSTREAIAIVYRVLNDYAGSVGEVLGVSLFAGLWLVIISLSIFQTKVLPNWLGFWGLVSATLLLVQLAKLFGVELGAFISMSMSVLHLWFLALGIVLLRYQTERSQSV
jgi:Domain of unknown function (DUF4386)